MQALSPSQSRLRRYGFIAGLLLVLLVALILMGRKQMAPPPPVDVIAVPAEPPVGMEPISEQSEISQPPVIEAQLESGQRIRLHQRESLRRPDPPFAERYPALLSQAESGGHGAQMQLGLMLYDCRNMPEALAELEQKIDVLYQTRQLDGWDISDPKLEEALLRAKHADCAGIPQQARGEYRQWIRRAAENGLMEAQLRLMYHLPPGEYCQYIEQCTPQQRELMAALRQEAKDYVYSAKQAGSVEALRTIAGWHMNEEMAPPDFVQAYAHFLAFDQIMSAAGRDARVEVMLASLEQKLRGVEIEAARALAAQILANPSCCVMTP
ncbi:MAG: hypothetical protein ACPGZP_09360 [Panacagrimonas sp.]